MHVGVHVLAERIAFRFAHATHRFPPAQIDMDWHDSYPRGVPNVPPSLSLPRELEPWTGFTL